MPPEVAEIRREMCLRSKCDTAHDFNDPFAACAIAGWGRYHSSCESVNRPAFNEEKKAKSVASILPPGDLLKIVIQKITGAVAGPNCSCNTRAAQMNAWGWCGCWRRRDVIVGWLSEEAARRGHEMDARRVRGLLRAAWREMLREARRM